MVSRETTRPLRKLVPAVAIGVSALLGVVGCSAGQVAQTAEMEPAVNGNMAQVGNLMLRDVMVAFPENGEPYRTGEDAPLQLTIVNVGGEDDTLTSVTSEAGDVEIIGNAKIPGRSALEVVLPGDNPAATSSEPSSEPSSSESESESESSESTETTGESTESAPTSSETESESTGEVTASSSAVPPSTATLTQTEAPDVVGTISLLITGLRGDLPFGKQVEVTFTFEKAGQVKVTLPVAAPATARPDGRDDHVAENESEGH